MRKGEKAETEMRGTGGEEWCRCGKRRRGSVGSATGGVRKGERRYVRKIEVRLTCLALRASCEVSLPKGQKRIG